MLAVTAHVAQTYGGLRRSTELARGGLAPWQVKRACEKLESDLGGKISLEQIAADFDLSVSHFSRAFRVSTGLPPHQWLLRQRVNTAKQLMSVRDLLAVGDCDIGRVRQSKPFHAGVFLGGRRQPGGVAPRNAGRTGRRNLNFLL